MACSGTSTPLGDQLLYFRHLDLLVRNMQLLNTRISQTVENDEKHGKELYYSRIEPGRRGLPGRKICISILQRAAAEMIFERCGEILAGSKTTIKGYICYAFLWLAEE